MQEVLNQAQSVLVNALALVILAAAPIIAKRAIDALQAFAAKQGIELNQARLDRLDAMLVNGMNAAAAAATSGKTKEQIKSDALAYARQHGPELLDSLKADLSDPKTQAALRARMETLIANPSVPTPAGIGK